MKPQLSLVDSLERELEAAWQESDSQRERQLQTSVDALTTTVQQQLEELLGGVRGSLAEDQPAIEAEVEKLMEMGRQFRAGVEIWQHKAQSSIRTIEEKQRGLGLLVQETSIRTNARREDLLRRHQQRAAECEEKCMQLLQDADTSREEYA